VEQTSHTTQIPALRVQLPEPFHVLLDIFDRSQIEHLSLGIHHFHRLRCRRAHLSCHRRTRLSLRRRRSNSTPLANDAKVVIIGFRCSGGGSGGGSGGSGGSGGGSGGLFPPQPSSLWCWLKAEQSEVRY